MTIIIIIIITRIATYLFLVVIPHVTAIVFLECVIRSITEYGLQLNKERKIIVQSLSMIVRSIFHNNNYYEEENRRLSAIP